MKYFYILCLALCSLMIAGCETPEGGSSLPWSQPESWEKQTVPMVGEES